MTAHQASLSSHIMQDIPAVPCIALVPVSGTYGRLLMLTGAGFALDLDGKTVWKSAYVEEWKGEYKCNEDHLFNLTLTSTRIMHGIMYIMQWFILASEVVSKWNNVPFCNGSDQWRVGWEDWGHALPVCSDWALQGFDWYMMSSAKAEFGFFLHWLIGVPYPELGMYFILSTTPDSKNCWERRGSSGFKASMFME